MKTVAVLALLAVAIAAVAAAPQRVQSKLQQAKNIQLKSNSAVVLKHKLAHHARSTLALDPVVLDEAVLNAYIDLQYAVEDFLLTALEAAYESDEAFNLIVDVYYSVMEATTYHYYDFSDAILAGSVDDVQIRALVEEVVAFGNDATAGAVASTTEAIEQYVPEALEQTKEHGQYTVEAVKEGLQAVLNLLNGKKH